MPYKIKTDIDEIEMKCELCLELPCCPEHCCNVSGATYLQSCLLARVVVTYLLVLFSVGHMHVQGLR